MKTSILLFLFIAASVCCISQTKVQVNNWHITDTTEASKFKTFFNTSSWNVYRSKHSILYTATDVNDKTEFIIHAQKNMVEGVDIKVASWDADHFINKYFKGSFPIDKFNANGVAFAYQDHHYRMWAYKSSAEITQLSIKQIN